MRIELRALTIPNIKRQMHFACWMLRETLQVLVRQRANWQSQDILSSLVPGVT